MAASAALRAAPATCISVTSMPKGSRIPRRPTSRSGHFSLPSGKIADRLRSRRCHVSALLRLSLRARLAQSRRYTRLSRPDHASNPSPSPRMNTSNPLTTNAWRREIRSSFNVPAPQPAPAPHPRSQPAPKPPASASAPPTPLEAGPVYPEPRSEPGSSASASFSFHLIASAPASRPTAPSPHTPLPPTSTEFLQQVLAGLFLFSRPFLQLCPARTPSAQPAPSSPSTPPTPTNSQPVPTPLAPQLTSPQQSQPTQDSQHNLLPAPAPPIPACATRRWCPRQLGRLDSP